MFASLRSRSSTVAGFTMIELLVAITIMGLMVGGAIAGYVKFNDRQILVQSAKTFISQMRSAQTKANAGIRDEATCTGLLGYRITATSGSSTYTVSAVCVSGSPVPETRILSKNVVFGADQNIFFQGISGSITSQNATIVLTYNSLSYQISVTSAGSISDDGIL